MPKPSPPPDQQSYFVLLCQGTMADGNSYWAYLKISPVKAKAFKQAQAAGAFQLQDFGDILCWGVGESVPDETRERMEREELVCHSLEDELQRKLREYRP